MRGVHLSQPLAWLSLAAYASAQVVLRDLSFGHDGQLSPNGRGIPGWSVSSENHQIQILSDHFILTPPIPGHAKGAAWSDATASSSEWSAEFEFRASGQDQAAGNLMETGSLNIWFVKDKHAVDRNTIYTVGKWDGLAIVLDQYGGGGGKVRGFLNDGEKDYSHSSNPAPFAFGHCDYSYRNLGRPSKIRINHQNGLTVSVDDRECFKTDKVQLPSGYSYGITAATGDNPDSFEIFKFVVYSGTPNKQQQQNQSPPPQQSQQPTLQKLDRLPGSPEMMADKNAEEIKGTDAQFEDLHNRLQGMTHQTANIFAELDSISRKIDGKLDDMQKQIIGSIPASPQTLTAGDFADLKRKVEAIERTVQQIQRDVEGKDYSEHISNLQMAVEGIRGTVSEHLPNTVKTIIHGTAPRMGLFVAVIVAVQLALAAAFVIYKRRRNSMPKNPTVTTPPKRKRELDTDASQTAYSLPSHDSHKATKVSHVTGTAREKDLPATPQTLGSGKGMDSDDDFNSVASSVELDEEMSSSVDFGAADSDLDDFQDDEAPFDIQEKDDIVPKRKAYEVDFKVYSPADIQGQQDCQVADVANLIEQPAEATAILLRYGRWNKERLIEQYMDNQEEVLDKAGLGQDISRNPPRIEVIDGFSCEICCEDESGLESFAMNCGHRFCATCYRHYLFQKIKEEGEAARIKCPGDGCNKIIDAKSLDLLVTPDLGDRYHELLMRTYVDDKESLKWCPAPNCMYAVECGVKNRDLNRIVPTVHCDCKHSFCFGCGQPDHQPCPCSLVKKWLKKCEDDSETANWISANTKECPKCNSTIEKNGGCNHMTCRKCRHEFCWMCMGVWSEHGTSWYNCNRFEEKSGSDARDAQARSRQSLERYLHYYNRYANHEQSAKLDKDIFHKTEKKMQLLQASSGMSWIEVQFLESASQALQQCRQTLKWTYAFAYYLQRNNLTEIFEDNQKDLEMAVENLSEMFEKPMDQLAQLKVEMMDKTTYCMRRRVILLDETAKDLKVEKWKFNVDLS